MLRNRSVPVNTIDGIEFVNLEPSDVSPLISECEIKVLYLGENRNRSYIDKETALEMAKTLRAVPIVGAYRQEIEDFGDHGHVVVIEDGEIKFSCKTVPYGFVSPDAKVWFQKFNDYDAFGNQIEREYMMTTGYLWTAQYEEALQCIECGKGQSMELDEETIDGNWATNNNSGIDFFIINDAIFTKLCILGDDVEPCFEGAAVTAPQTSTMFTRDIKFENTLFAKMEELKNALQNKGGSEMLNEEFEAAEAVEETPVTEFEEAAAGGESSGDSAESGADSAEDSTTSESEGETGDVVEEQAPEASEEETEEPAGEDEPAQDDAEDDAEEEENENPISDSDEAEEIIDSTPSTRRKQELFTCEDEEKDIAVESVPADEPVEVVEEQPVTEHSLDDVEEKYVAISAEYEASKAEFAAVKAELEAVKAELADASAELVSLREFKLGIENQQKDEIINKFFMLDDDDKEDVLSHKEEYTCEQIEEKLSLIYVRKNVNFGSIDGEAEEEVVEETPAAVFSLDAPADLSFAYVSPELEALRRARDN